MSIEALAQYEFYERDGSRRERITPDGPEIDLLLRCRWADRYWIVDHICPPGMAWPGREHLTCQDIQIDGVVPYGTPGSGYILNPLASYKEANISATFRLRVYDQSGGATEETTRQSWDIGAEVLELGISREWETAGTKVDVPVNVLLPYVSYEYEQTFDSSSILAQIEGLVGKVNSVEWRGKAAQTCLYLGAAVTQVFDQNGNERFRVRSRIAGRNRSWNVFYRSARQKRYPPGHEREGQLVFDSNGNPEYVTGPAGTAGWDTMVPAAYETADFAAVLD